MSEKHQAPEKKQNLLDCVFKFFDTHPDKPLAPEPTLSPLTDPISLPFIGALKAYYLALVLFFLLFILSHQNMLVGILAGLTLLFIVLWEFYCGMVTGGIKAELKETGIAILIALLVWFGSGFILQTPTPINAIVSCSMLPSFERGDLVILQGGAVNTAYFNYSGSASNINSSGIVTAGQQSFPVNGSMLSHCQQTEGDPYCAAFLRQPNLFSETHGPVTIQYAACERDSRNGARQYAICAAASSVNGVAVPFDPKAELVVYSTPADAYWAGVDIVHRVRFALNTSTGVIYFTKGDNNPAYDFMAYDEASGRMNSPVSPSQVKGRVILRIPQLGSFKLFITPQVLGDLRTQNMCDSNFAQAT